MPDDDSVRKLNERIIAAFQEAYPDVPRKNLEHMARNFIQVVNGVMDVGGRIETSDEPAHMDIANSMIYWCVTNTSLEDYLEGDAGPIIEDNSIARLTRDEMEQLIREFAARAADWLIGLEVLREDPELFNRFIRGALAFGAEDWEKNRGDLGY